MVWFLGKFLVISGVVVDICGVVVVVLVCAVSVVAVCHLVSVSCLLGVVVGLFVLWLYLHLHWSDHLPVSGCCCCL